MEYDRANWTPVIRRQKDLEQFQRRYGVDHLPEIY